MSTSIDPDNDGKFGDEDMCPGFNDNIDTDADSIPNGCDTNNNDGPLGDQDDDGVNNQSDICPGFDDAVDTDGDGIPNGCDTNNNDGPLGDTDIDGVTNIKDKCPDTAATENADVNGCSPSQKDSDGDSINDKDDIFPYDPLRWTYDITPMINLLLLGQAVLEGDLDNNGCVDKDELSEILRVIRGLEEPNPTYKLRYK